MRHFDPPVSQAVKESRAQAGAVQSAPVAATRVKARVKVEEKQILEHDDFALRTLHLSDVRDLPGAVFEPRLMQDQVDGRRHLLADRALSQLDVGHHHHRFHPRQRVSWRVGVNSGDGAIVARVHRLEHVEGGLVTYFADDDPVWPHTHRVADEVTDGDLTAFLQVGRPRLQSQYVLLAQLKLRCVLDGDNPLVRWHECGQHVERGRLARAGAAADHYVEAALDADSQQVGYLGGHRAELDQMTHRKRLDGELPDCQQ